MTPLNETRATVGWLRSRGWVVCDLDRDEDLVATFGTSGWRLSFRFGAERTVAAERMVREAEAKARAQLSRGLAARRRS